MKADFDHVKIKFCLNIYRLEVSMITCSFQSPYLSPRKQFIEKGYISRIRPCVPPHLNANKTMHQTITPFPYAISFPFFLQYSHSITTIIYTCIHPYGYSNIIYLRPRLAPPPHRRRLRPQPLRSCRTPDQTGDPPRLLRYRSRRSKHCSWPGGKRAPALGHARFGSRRTSCMSRKK